MSKRAIRFAVKPRKQRANIPERRLAEMLSELLRLRVVGFYKPPRCLRAWFGAPRSVRPTVLFLVREKGKTLAIVQATPLRAAG
jgi:hypothetical protein